MKRILTCASAIAAALTFSVSAQAAGMLMGANGMTLYVFDKDAGGVSSCYDACATHWPAYMGKKGEKMTEGWTEVKRKDGKMQMAYDGKPVYFFAGDKKKGDMAGDGMGGVWHIIKE